MSETAPRPAAFWDIDRTMLQGSTLLILLRPMHKQGFVQLRTLGASIFRQAAFSRGGFSDAELESGADLAASLAKGLDARELERLGHQFVPHFILPRIYPQARARLQEQRKRGVPIFLISSAPREIVVPLANALGATDSASTIADVDENGLYAGTVSLFMHGEAKAEAARQLAERWNIDLQKSAAFADSSGDEALLSMVGNPYCVNPDRGLLKAAVARRWPCLAFSSDRSFSVPRPSFRRLVTATAARLPAVPTRGSFTGVG